MLILRVLPDCKKALAPGSTRAQSRCRDLAQHSGRKHGASEKPIAAEADDHCRDPIDGIR